MILTELAKVLILSIALQVPAPAPHMAKASASPTTNNKPSEPSTALVGREAPKDNEYSARITSLPQLILANRRNTTADHIFDWGPWAFDLALVIVGGMQAYTMVRQTRLSGGTLDAVKRQGDIAANASRAWVIISLENRSPELKETEIGNVYQNILSISLKNVGQTPAHLTRMAARYVKLSRAEFEQLPEDPHYGQRKDVDGNILVPTDSLGTVVFLEPIPTLSREELISIRNGELILYFYAVAEYKDAFGASCETRAGHAYHFPQGGRISYEKQQFQRAGPRAYNRAT
jgi:hypothetical protein